jgi:hypothetical protein
MNNPVETPIVIRESGLREMDFGNLDDLNWNKFPDVQIPVDIDWSELINVEY